MRKESVPWTITGLRLFTLPLLIYSFIQEIQIIPHALFLFAASTDFLDGYIAKKLETTSTLGLYFDVTTDFIFVSSIFLVFILEEFYPLWILAIIVFVFAQFILTSIYLKRTTYDPVGKYYGSLIYGGIGFTLLSQEKLMFELVTIGITVSTIAVLVSRATFLLKRHKQS